MDFAYGHRAVRASVTRASKVGRKIYETTYAAVPSQSVRQRTDVVADEIRASANERGKIRVASFAAGHSRELEKLGDLGGQISEFVSIDADEASIGEAMRSYRRAFTIVPFHRNVLRVRAAEIGLVDVAYSMGLFDYLDQRLAKRVMRLMAAIVAPGGKLLVGNLSDTAANLAYFEGVMDWWMIPRSRKEMADLGHDLEAAGGWKCEVFPMGCFYYLLAVRQGGASP